MRGVGDALPPLCWVSACSTASPRSSGATRSWSAWSRTRPSSPTGASSRSSPRSARSSRRRSPAGASASAWRATSTSTASACARRTPSCASWRAASCPRSTRAWPRSTRRSSSSSSPRTPTTSATPCSRSVPARAATRRVSSPQSSSACTRATPTGLGGFKEVIVLVAGKGVFSRLKFEGGVHRVQRVPVTETQGRIHTSAVTVAVLPEAEDIEVELDDRDLRIDVFRSSGPGGQSVNTTDSAVRVTHLPSALVVTCQDEKSQHKNKAKALKILRARLLDRARQEQQSEIAASRRAMVGSGDRSEKIRTYNFPQSRVTDHRVNVTLHTLDRVLDGEIDPIVDALVTRQQAEALAAAG